MELSVIIPAFNEEAAIADALADVRDYCASRFSDWEVIVVDDGSRDRTSEIASGLATEIPQLRTVRLPQNSGKGAAVKEGFRQANGRWILMLDADRSTPVAALDAWRPFDQGADITIGSRDVPGSRILRSQPAYRTAAGRLMNALIRAKTGLPFRDTQCGFKLFSAHAKPLFESLQTNRWLFDAEILCHAQNAGLTIKEVPVEWTNGAQSKLRLTHAWDVLRELMRLPRASRSS
jgi:dolichyl-phosphate beta-glucosyltransferase